QQQDSVGLATFDNQVRDFLRPSSQPSHLKQIVQVLNRSGGKEKSGLGPIFHDLAERLTHRAIIVVLSDLFEEPTDILNGLKHVRHKYHEVIVMHVLDRAELEFPFRDATLFRGLEQLPDLLTDPRSLRDGYLAEMQAFQQEIERGCRTMNIDHVRLTTDTSLGVVLSSYLAHRLARSSR